MSPVSCSAAAAKSKRRASIRAPAPSIKLAAALPFSLTPTRLADGLGRRSVLSVRALFGIAERARAIRPATCMKLSGRVVPPRRTGKRLAVQLRQTNCQRQRILRLSKRQHNLQIADCGLRIDKEN